MGLGEFYDGMAMVSLFLMPNNTVLSETASEGFSLSHASPFCLGWAIRANFPMRLNPKPFSGACWG